MLYNVLLNRRMLHWSFGYSVGVEYYHSYVYLIRASHFFILCFTHEYNGRGMPERNHLTEAGDGNSEPENWNGVESYKVPLR